MSLKRRRNEIDIINDSDLIDNLDKYPYLLRSIQAGKYILENPIILSQDLSDFQILKSFKDYLWFIIKKFFSNCGLYYYDNEIGNSDDEIEVMIHTPLPESQVSLNFAILIDNFVNMCRLHLNEKNFKVTFF